MTILRANRGEIVMPSMFPMGIHIGKQLGLLVAQPWL